MERASLHAVPRRPAGPVDPNLAAAHVGARLPDLDEPARRALALVEIAGRARDGAAAELGVGPGELAEALARGRKALRRSMFPRSASGWCERAERLISDRLDGELPPPGPARLDAHLRNCERCVEHELRLDQARASLVEGFLDTLPAPAVPAEPEPGPPPKEVALRVVEYEPEMPEPGPEMPEPEPEEPEPGPELPEPEPGEPEPEREVPEPRVPQPVAADDLEPARSATALVWTALYALSGGLAVGSLLITILAAAGVLDV